MWCHLSYTPRIVLQSNVPWIINKWIPPEVVYPRTKNSGVYMEHECEPTSLINQPIRCKEQLTAKYICFTWPGRGWSLSSNDSTIITNCFDFFFFALFSEWKVIANLVKNIFCILCPPKNMGLFYCCKVYIIKGR